MLIVIDFPIEELVEESIWMFIPKVNQSNQPHNNEPSVIDSRTKIIA